MNSLRVISSEVSQKYTDLFRTVVRIHCCHEGKKFDIFFQYKKDNFPVRLGKADGVKNSRRGYLPNIGYIFQVVNKTVQQCFSPRVKNVENINEPKKNKARLPDGRAGETVNDWGP